MFFKSFTGMSVRAAVLWNTGSQIVGKLFTAGTTFLVTLLIAREFGAAGFGDFTKITTYVAFFFIVADFGLNAIYIQKEQKQNSDQTLFASLLGLRIVGSGFLMFLSLAILAFIPHGVTQGYTAFVRLGIILFSPAILFQALITTANAVFQKNMRYDLSALSVAAGSIVTVLLLWFTTVVFRGSAGILGGMLSVLGGTTVNAAVAYLLIRTLHTSLTVSFSINAMKALFWGSVPLGLALLFNLVYFHIDSVILALTRSTAEVGIYGLAYKFFEIPLVIPTFFMNAMYPIFLEKAKSGPLTNSRQFRALFTKSFIVLSFLSFAFLIVLWIAAPYFTLIQKDFSSSIAPLRVLSLGLPFFFLSALSMWSIIALGKQRMLLFIYGCSMALNIFLTVLFVPSYGYMAASWITVWSEALVLGVSFFMLYRILKTRDTIAQLPDGI